MAALIKKIWLPEPLNLGALVELKRVLELTCEKLQSGVFNDRLIKALLTGLKEHGPNLEKYYGEVVERTFRVFTAAIDNQTLSIANRTSLFELVLLRKSNWKNRAAGSLAKAYKMLKTSTRGTQTPHTPAGVTEAATNTEQAPVGKPRSTCPRSINGIQQITYEHYVKGSGFEIKVSGTSARLVADVKGMIDNFFNNEEALNEALKANAHALKILKPPLYSTPRNNSSEKKQEGVDDNAKLSALDKIILDALPQLLDDVKLSGYSVPSAVVKRNIVASESECDEEKNQEKQYPSM